MDAITQSEQIKELQTAKHNIDILTTYIVSKALSRFGHYLPFNSLTPSQPVWFQPKTSSFYVS